VKYQSGSWEHAMMCHEPQNPRAGVLKRASAGALFRLSALRRFS
jgi:hypothetical protein